MPTAATVTRMSRRRAAFALEHIRTLSAATRNGFRDKVKGAPAMILQNGLGAALAFMLGKDDHREVAKAVLAWIVREGILPGLKSDPTQGELIEGLNSLGLNDYLRAQQEALEVLAWLKRYADAELWR